MYLVTSEQMQALDRHTLTTLQVPGIVLMDHAGKAVAEEVMAGQPKRVVLLCGKGNNGGDGWLAARWLKHWGIPDVRVVSVANLEALQGDASQAARMAQSAGVPYVVYRPNQPLPEADVYVDALLGTGQSRPLQGALATLAESVNAATGFKVAADVPTGVNASHGGVSGVAIAADVTVCMAYQKLGTAITPGCHYAGEVKVADIGIAPLSTDESVARFITPAEVRANLPARSVDSHKGTFGKVGIAVGSMAGAAELAGLGAARIGAGLIAMGCEGPLQRQLPVEFVVRQGVPTKVLADCDALVIGPGLGTAFMAWADLVKQHGRFGVLDADGLRLLDEVGPLPAGRWVVTPHPKECARLLGWETSEVQGRRLQAARLLADQTGALVVLKGYRSLIAAPDGRVWINPTGDASLATAGTGDVLAGMIGGLLAQGVDPVRAATTAAWLHGRAGELAGLALTSVSTMASDVVDFISRAIIQCFDTISG